MDIKHILFVVVSFILLCAACADRSQNKHEDSSLDAKYSNVASEAAQLSDDGLPVIIDFSAAWCPPCRQFAPIFEAVADKYKGKVKMVSIDVDENKQLAQTFGIENIPALVFITPDGKIIDKTTGLMSERDLTARVEDLLSASSTK